MNWEHVKELININLIYANPQILGQVRAKQAKKPHKKISAIKSIRNQYLWVSGLFFLIYSTMFLGVDYRQSAGYFSVQLALFSLMALATGFNSLFAVFYDSKDTRLYLSLPVRSEEVYLAKLLSAQPALLTYLLPLLSLVVIAYWQIGSPAIAILVALPIFLLLLLTLNALALLLLHVIGQVLVKSRHKKLISSALVLLSTLLSIGMIYGVQMSSMARFDGDGGILSQRIPYFIGFYELIVAPFSLSSLLHFWLPLLILAGLVTTIIKVVIPNYFNQLLNISANQAPGRKARARTHKERSVKQTLIRHHLGTLKDGTLLIQAFLLPMIMLFSSIMPMLVRSREFGQLDQSYYGIPLVLGLVLGLMTAGPTSLLSVGISLERENLRAIQALPINFKKFLQSKFYTLFAVQVFPIIVIHLLGAGLLLKLSPLLLLSYSLGHLASAYLMGLFSFRRDYRLLDLNWQNVTQLYSRGGSQWLMAGIFLVSMFGGMAAIITAIILTQYFPPYLISLVLSSLASICLGLGYWLIGRQFWIRFHLDRD